ncbi:MAG: hypothetical protein ABSG91_08255 [Syntrophobacteraceae bacterium]|jgi:hypothetical protein
MSKKLISAMALSLVLVSGGLFRALADGGLNDADKKDIDKPAVYNNQNIDKGPYYINQNEDRGPY